MIGGCALNHGLKKVHVQKCGTSVHGGCAQFMTTLRAVSISKDALQLAKWPSHISTRYAGAVSPVLMDIHVGLH